MPDPNSRRSWDRKWTVLACIDWFRRHPWTRGCSTWGSAHSSPPWSSRGQHLPSHPETVRAAEKRTEKTTVRLGISCQPGGWVTVLLAPDPALMLLISLLGQEPGPGYRRECSHQFLLHWCNSASQSRCDSPTVRAFQPRPWPGLLDHIPPRFLLPIQPVHSMSLFRN